MAWNEWILGKLRARLIKCKMMTGVMFQKLLKANTVYMYVPFPKVFMWKL